MPSAILGFGLKGAVSPNLEGLAVNQVCVLVAGDREKNTVSKVSCQGPYLYKTSE